MRGGCAPPPVKRAQPTEKSKSTQGTHVPPGRSKPHAADRKGEFQHIFKPQGVDDNPLGQHHDQPHVLPRESHLLRLPPSLGALRRMLTFPTRVSTAAVRTPGGQAGPS